MAEVRFWSLRQKFLDSDEDMPANAKQVMYYSLAIGHHVGVIDCLNQEFACPLELYRQWVELLAEGDARRKLQGLLTFGEIVIDSTHTDLLATALAPLAAGQTEPFNAWSAQLIGLLGEIAAEPAIYLIVRRVL